MAFEDALEQEKRRAQLRSQRIAQQNYETQKAQLDNKYNGGLGGFLGGIIGGIGKGVSDVGNSLIDIFGSSIASLRDLGSIKETGKSAGEQEKWLKFRRGTDDINDARLKTAGQALNAATTLASTAVPGLSSGAAAKALGGTIANTAGGAIGGIADEFQQQGKDARLDSATNRAVSGAAAGLATGILGNKIGNAKSSLGKTLLNNKLATSTIGRGALSGAVGGGVGAGTSAALSGGDVLGETIEGAKSGAISGGVQAGVTSAAKTLVDSTAGKAVRNRWEKQQDRNFEKAIKNPSKVKKDVYLGELSEKNYNDVSKVLNKVGLTDADGDAAITVQNNAMYLTPEGAQHLYERRIQSNNITPETMRQVMRNATNGVVLDTPSRANNAVMGAMNSDGRKVDIAYLGPTQEGNLSLASAYPEKSGATSRAIKNTLDASQTRRTTGDTSLAAGNISALQGINNSIAQDKQNVNGDVPSTQMYRGQGTGTDDFYLNNNGRISNTVGDGYYLSTDRGVSEAFAQDGGGIISPNIDNTKIASKQEVENIIKQATDTVNDSKRYEELYNSNPELAELYDNVALGRYDAIAKTLGKPVVPTIETDSNGEYLYYKGVDNDYDTVLKSQLSPQPEPQPVVETPVVYEQPEFPDYTTPIDYQGNELKIRNKNLLEKAGDIIAGAGEAIKNGDVYNSLYSKTANRVTRNDSINKLRQLGFEPADYAEAAKISTTTNKFVDDIVKNSGATVTDNTFAQRVLTPDDNIIISDPTYQKKYDTKVKQLLDRIETGRYPGQYNAADLLKESRQFGDWANDLRKKSTNVNGDVTNRDGYELAAAYTDVKYALRDLASEAVDGFGDKYTKSQLSDRLKKLGAPQKAIDYMLDADDIGGFIRNTSLFEDARQMAREMAETKVRRNANAGKSTNPLTIMANAAGIPQLVEAALTPVGRATGGLAKGIGETIQNIGGKLPESGQMNLSPQMQAILENYVGRTQGNIAADNLVQNARKNEEYDNLENMLTSLQAQEAQYQSEQAEQPYNPEAERLANELKNIATAMDNAMAAGDFNAYNKLASLYKTAYSMYNIRVPQENSTLTSTEKTKQAKLKSAESALDELENLYSRAGGAQGNVRGGISSWLSDLGMNDNLNSYNQTAKSLINQISAATGTVDKGLIPLATDSEEEAQRKIDQLRRLIQQTNNSYASVYNW